MFPKHFQGYIDERILRKKQGNMILAILQIDGSVRVLFVNKLTYIELPK